MSEHARNPEDLEQRAGIDSESTTPLVPQVGSMLGNLTLDDIRPPEHVDSSPSIVLDAEKAWRAQGGTVEDVAEMRGDDANSALSIQDIRPPARDLSSASQHFVFEQMWRMGLPSSGGTLSLEQRVSMGRTILVTVIALSFWLSLLPVALQVWLQVEWYYLVPVGLFVAAMSSAMKTGFSHLWTFLFGQAVAKDSEEPINSEFVNRIGLWWDGNP